MPPKQKISNSSTGPTPASMSSAQRKATPGCVSPAHAIRVLCVDDHAVLVEGLKAQFAIDRSIECVGYLPSAANLPDEASRAKPDVVLLDIEMPGPDVFEMADRLRHLHPSIRFIFLSAHVRDGYLAAAYKCGAWGYFAKGDDLQDILAGIKEVANSRDGVFVLGPKVKQRCQPATVTGGRNRSANSGDYDPRPQLPLESLSTREIEVLRLIGKGKSRSEVAKELSRSAKTIDGHQERIMKKLGLHSRADLMRFAIREGLAEA